MISIPFSPLTEYYEQAKQHSLFKHLILKYEKKHIFEHVAFHTSSINTPSHCTLLLNDM